MNTRFASLLALLGIHQHLSAEQKNDLATAAYQSAPGAAAASSAGAVGLPLSDLLVLASIAFVALQAAYLVWKWRRDARRDQERQEDRRRGRPVETDLGSLGADE
ncbi:putative membrane protein YfcA [Acidovorax soli]|uniref:Putative membrane protein YfcA n=1 Tax=Acidovorax soli TaxID=592050 RepID=A0A7X0PCU6_9BURK|nr:hypothetical protein [Acidovorax soli]MBB6559570.1 putative membrane protein YfcA [Acidovorax soli]